MTKNTSVFGIYPDRTTVSDAIDVLTRVADAIPKLGTLLSSYPLTGELILAVALIVVLVLLEILDERQPIWDRLRTQPVVLRWGFYYCLLIALIVIGKWGLTQFVYMQF